MGSQSGPLEPLPHWGLASRPTSQSLVLGQDLQGSSHPLPAVQGADGEAGHEHTVKYLNATALLLQLLKLVLCLSDLLPGSQYPRSQLVLWHPSRGQATKEG